MFETLTMDTVKQLPCPSPDFTLDDEFEANFVKLLNSPLTRTSAMVSTSLTLPSITPASNIPSPSDLASS
uniref:AGC-kinase C-terminal domain-containing protein n=1 Tax=Panagrellus redivivus TaxID=6233 RepID=A0A7E4W9Y9_PANRE